MTLKYKDESKALKCIGNVRHSLAAMGALAEVVYDYKLWDAELTW